MNFQTRLAEILDYLGESYYPMHEYPDQPIYTDRNKEAIAEAQQQITELFKEIIGEEDTNYPSLNLDKTPHEDAVIRNQLKSEIRKAIND